MGLGSIKRIGKRIVRAPRALRSRARNARNDACATRLLGCLDASWQDAACIEVDRMEDFFDGRELVHGSIFVPWGSEETMDAALSFEVFDAKGQALDAFELFILRDSQTLMATGAEALCRCIEFSFMKPYGMECFFVRVSFEDDALPAGVLCVDENMTQDMRSRFHHVYDNGPGGYGYHDWFMTTQRTPSDVRRAQRQARFTYEPMFSIIVPLYETPLEFLHAMVESVLMQTYGKLELVLVNASPDNAELAIAVREYGRSDERVKFVALEENQGIALNTLAGIAAASGDFLCFLDHDDVLEEDALYEYVRALNEEPEADLIYCDEDMISGDRYVRGFLKPDYDPYLLEGLNYITHFLAVRKSLVERLPELPGKELDGSQDHGLTLMACERARSVVHVPKVLYHWRIHEHSTAGDNGADKPWAAEAGARAVREHLKRIGVDANISPNALGHGYDIDYVLGEHPPKVGIVIPNKDCIDLLKRCLDSIYEKSSYENYEIVIVENNSEQETTFSFYDELEKAHENLSVVRYEGTFNFAAICNAGARATDAELLLFLNNDTELATVDWLQAMAGPLTRDSIACVGAKLLYPDHTVQHLGVNVPRYDPSHFLHVVPEDTRLYYGYPWFVRSSSAVTGACMMVRRVEFEEIGGFDEEFAVAYNDIDLCLRLRALGKDVVMQPRAVLYHFESASRGYDAQDTAKYARQMREMGLFRARWSEYYAQGDPFYSNHFGRGTIYCDLDWSERSWRH